MPIGATPQIQKEMLMNLGINLEDILAYLQYLITNVLEYADYINIWFVSP